MTLCPKCGNTTFTSSVKQITNLNLRIALISCKACGSIVGTVDLTTAERIEQIEQMVRRLQ